MKVKLLLESLGKSRDDTVPTVESAQFYPTSLAKTSAVRSSRSAETSKVNAEIRVYLTQWQCTFIITSEA